MDLIATHMYVWSTEADPDGTAAGRFRSILGIPREWIGCGASRAVSGLASSSFIPAASALTNRRIARLSEPYLLSGFVAEWRVGRARLFVNVENLSDIRQTNYDPLVRPSPGPLGVWTVDAWGPLEGRILNGGIRLGCRSCRDYRRGPNTRS